MAGIDSPARLPRTAFRTSRLLDFASEKELTAQIGHPPNDWPLVIVKELIDNALDACEEAGIAPEISVCVDERGITVTDNGPGLPAEVVEGVLDFSVRVSSREAYVAPDRGAQGNALKTLLAMPFALDGNVGRVVTFPPSRTTPSMEAQRRLIDPSFEPRSLMLTIGRQSSVSFRSAVVESALSSQRRCRGLGRGAFH